MAWRRYSSMRSTECLVFTCVTCCITPDLHVVPVSELHKDECLNYIDILVSTCICKPWAFFFTLWGF